VLGVVPAVAALDAEPPVAAGAVAALGEDDGVSLLVHAIGERAADAAIGAHGVDGRELAARTQRFRHGAVHQRAGRTRRRALAAGDAGARAHRRIQVEGDARGVALAAAAHYLVALHIVAGANAAVAEDAGLVIDGDHLRAWILRAAVAAGKRPSPGVVAPRQGHQLVAAEGGFLRIVLDLGLVRHQELGPPPCRPDRRARRRPPACARRRPPRTSGTRPRRAAWGRGTARGSRRRGGAPPPRSSCPRAPPAGARRS
jgi:hypothetical protein